MNGWRWEMMMMRTAPKWGEISMKIMMKNHLLQVNLEIK